MTATSDISPETFFPPVIYRLRYPLFALLVIFALLPFSNKPFFIDDYYHYLMARGIINNPLRPYDFLSDDDGHDNPAWEYGALPRMVNPPLTHYCLALVIRIFGKTERAAHIGFMFFAVASALLFLFISEKFLSPPYPLIAALLFAFNPVFWITSNGLMLDSVKLTFYLASLASLISATEKNNSWLLPALAGFFMGLAILAKYTAFSVIPVSFIYLVMFDDKWKKKLFVFAVPFLMLFLWSWWNIRAYGSPHLTSALKRTVSTSMDLKILVAMVFFSGGLIFVSGIVPAFISSFKNYKTILALSAVIFLGGVWLFSSPVGGFSFTHSILLSLWVVASTDFLVAVGSLWRNFDKKDRFLAAWFILVFITMLPAMSWTAGRYFMVLIPPAALLFVRMVCLVLPSQNQQKSLLASTTVITFIMGLLLAVTDYTQAGVYKKIRSDLNSDGVRPAYFKSDIFSGITGYLKSDGWRIVVPGEDVLKPGDLFLIGYISTPVAWIKEPEIQGRLELIKVYEYKTKLPFRVLSVPDSAGFYATCWGALPWSVSRLPLERYKLYLVVKDSDNKKYDKKN